MIFWMLQVVDCFIGSEIKIIIRFSDIASQQLVDDGRDASVKGPFHVQISLSISLQNKISHYTLFFVVNNKRKQIACI